MIWLARSTAMSIAEVLLKDAGSDGYRTDADKAQAWCVPRSRGRTATRPWRRACRLFA
jgi:hypothetical protein